MYICFKEKGPMLNEEKIPTANQQKLFLKIKGMTLIYQICLRLQHF